MRTSTKLVGFVIALVAVFAAAIGIGRLVGPVGTEVEASHAGAEHAGMEGMDMGSAPTSSADIPKGLMVSQDGYTFRLDKSTAKPGRNVPVSFRILGPDAAPVTEYDLTHEKELHLIAVRRDFSGFQHVHPVLDDEGTWSAPLDLRPGQWRLFADFQATGAEALTLGADLSVPGRYLPAPPAEEEVRTAKVGRYTVTLDGDLTAGEEAELTLTVTRDGEPVTDLEPYLGAYGHLVALRGGDLAYLHVHPEGVPGDGTTPAGPEVVFFAEVPSANGYRLFLDFKHEGVVRTAAFAVRAAWAQDDADSEDGGHDDAEHDE